MSEESSRSIFSGMRILIEQSWVQGLAVVVENRYIKAILPEEMIKHHLPARRYLFDESHYLVPGLIDLHLHGTHGKDVMDANENALQVISGALAEEGVTGYLATTMTATNKQIAAVLKVIRVARSCQEGAAILGVHLEGPFISPVKMGAQAGDSAQLPSVALVHHWQRLSDDAIKLVTLAPELPGAMALIDALHKMNVIASIGHSNATYEQTDVAIAAGCTQATHLFNAMSGLHQRQPGAAMALLLSKAVMAELIVDGLHLHPAMVDLAWQVKGKEGLLLVTDAMRAKCQGDGEYELGGQKVTVRLGEALLANGALAGSTLRLPQAIKNMVQFSHCSLAEAIHLASYNPAKVLGLLPRKGSIGVGKEADLVVFNAELAVQLTMREGREIFVR